VVKVVVEEGKNRNPGVEEVSVQVLKLEDGVSLSCVCERVFFPTGLVIAAQWMMEEMPVVILPVSITCQSEEPGEWNDEYCWAVERVDVATELSDGVCD